MLWRSNWDSSNPPTRNGGRHESSGSPGDGHDVREPLPRRHFKAAHLSGAKLALNVGIVEAGGFQSLLPPPERFDRINGLHEFRMAALDGGDVKRPLGVVVFFVVFFV